MPITPTGNPYQNPPQFQPTMPQQQMQPSMAIPNNRAFIFTGNAAQGGTVQMPGSDRAVPQSMWDTTNPTAQASRLTNIYTGLANQPGMNVAATQGMWDSMPGAFADIRRDPYAFDAVADQARRFNTVAQPASQQQIAPPGTGDAGMMDRGARVQDQHNVMLDGGERPYFNDIQTVAKKYGLDPEMLYRQLEWESGNFDPEVISGKRLSSAGAAGIAQFMPETAKSFGIDPLDVPAALDAAARYMRRNLDMFGGDQRAALAAYNAGEGTVGRLRKQYGNNWEDFLPAETKSYLQKVHDEVNKRSASPRMAMPSGSSAGAVPGQSMAQPMQVSPAGRTVQQINQSGQYASLEERLWYLQQLGATLSPNGVPMPMQGFPAMGQAR